MYEHSPMSVLFIEDRHRETQHPLAAYLVTIPHIHLQQEARLPADLSHWAIIVTSLETLAEEQVAHVRAHVDTGGGWLNLVGPGDGLHSESVFGVRLGPCGPQSELRVLFSKHDHPLSVRLPDAIYVKQLFRPLLVNTDDAETILYADWHYQHSAMLVTRSHGQGSLACTTLTDFSHPVLCQIMYRLIRHMGGCSEPRRPVGIGILGYAPSVGQYHGQGATQTPGLTLEAACDLSADRLQQARIDFPSIKTHAGAEMLGNDPDVDLVIIATPPNTHASLTLQMMAAGKHVICEKPLALNRKEAAAMKEAAIQHGVHLSCHQNRRWDVDYLAIKQALTDGVIGDVFYVETFVGGFSHPCGYWHSDARVSGGMTYDWGAHYIDWIVGLLGGGIESVVGTRHKRVWHDVTNADQERIQIRFAQGVEAEFIHSDIAAASKPKWYLLGTRGAIVGRWQHITTYQIDPVHYYERHAIPETEMPPDITIYQRQDSEKLRTIKPALPDRPKFGFHANLADHLLSGEPLIAPLQDSMRVVAILEAAALSMANNGGVEVVDV